jgi:hypothetical protein
MEKLENQWKSSIDQEKLKNLKNRLQEVNHIIDARGLGVDEEIKETVAILRAMDIATSSSCAGHIDTDAYSPPYIEVYTPSPEGWKEDKTNPVYKDQWRTEHEKHRQKLQPLLDEFYKERKVAKDIRLTLWKMGAFGAFRLQSEGVGLSKAEKLEILPQNYTKEDIFKVIKSYQLEMKTFTNFLRDQYLKT